MIEVTFTCNDCARQEKVLASISSWSYKSGENGYSQVYLTSVDLPESWVGIDTSPEKRCKACFEAHKVRMAGIEPEELAQALDAMDDNGIDYFADTRISAKLSGKSGTQTEPQTESQTVKPVRRERGFNTHFGDNPYGDSSYTGPDGEAYGESGKPDKGSRERSVRRSSGRSSDRSERNTDKRNTDRRNTGRTDKSVKRNTEKKALKPKKESARKDSPRKPKGKKKGEH